jgi:hypothetical protein
VTRANLILSSMTRHLSTLLEKGHVGMVSELLSAGAALEARAQVSAVGDDELSDESESDSL